MLRLRAAFVGISVGGSSLYHILARVHNADGSLLSVPQPCHPSQVYRLMLLNKKHVVTAQVYRSDLHLERL